MVSAALLHVVPSYKHMAIDLHSTRCVIIGLLLTYSPCRSLVKNKLEVLTKAGLNQESFDNMGLTRVAVRLYAFFSFSLH